ncbi:MAG TPA: NAD-dependent epimerase/dehydratase family protein [Puia sp.]|uniref:NAD-dependent epimerase/dehydratase family protein n=1 Tax=Puia sp. TaxID=2045100 RepID=UPI002CB212D7|nr:NAD-dependent epimerase/dehydratase family protein [Puia sp.]HVU94355.1 NAD-dependent epimerase/dehydratase family protein [Puia sp.]
MKKDNILVVGACGQIGTELTAALRRQYGDFHVIAADVRPATPQLEAEGPYEQFDVLNAKTVAAVINRHDITQVYLLAALLSATGEQQPQKAWQLNTQGLLNILEPAREKKVARIFWPSTIAVFGPDAPKSNCPQEARLLPSTMYGVSKAAGENLCQYYFSKYGVDVRSLRYPGLISYQAQPGGGTTDYSVDIFHQAVARGSYTCYLGPDTRLPMLYMPDAIRATMELMEVPAASLSVRTSYNLGGPSFTPRELAAAITAHLPDFSIDYQPDFRQAIADSWPRSIDDMAARRDWGWEYQYGLSALTRDMLIHIARRSGADPARLAKLSAINFF